VIDYRQMNLTPNFTPLDHNAMQFDWYGLFDELKRRGHFNSDAQLADSLMLTRAQISAWRTGKSELGTLTKIKILDALGQDNLRSAVMSLLPEKNRQEQIARHEQLIARVERTDFITDASSDVTPAVPIALPSTTNQLLAALPPDERERIEPHLSTVTMPLGQVVYESGDHLSHIYLPTTAIISLHGGRNHAQPSNRAKRRPRIPLERRDRERRIRPRRRVAAHFPSLHAGAHHTDGANRCLQPASLYRPAVLSLAPAQPR
jgi:hypothetical protein